MSQENVERVARVFSEGVPGLYLMMIGATEDFVWETTEFDGWPEPREFAGVSGFVEFMEAWVEPYDEWRIEVGQILNAGGDRVVALLANSDEFAGVRARSKCATASCTRFATGGSPVPWHTPRPSRPSKPPGCRRGLLSLGGRPGAHPRRRSMPHESTKQSPGARVAGVNPGYQRLKPRKEERWSKGLYPTPRATQFVPLPAWRSASGWPSQPQRWCSLLAPARPPAVATRMRDRPKRLAKPWMTPAKKLERARRGRPRDRRGREVAPRRSAPRS